MKQTMSRIVGMLMLTAAFAIVAPSCQKEQNANSQKGLGDLNAKPVISTCSPIPDTLRVPEGNKLVLQTFARGVQIYEVKRSTTDPTVFSWVNIAPLATLYANSNFTDEVIHHFAGPTWEFIKGSSKGERVVATKLSGVTQDPTAIQWLLLKAVDSLSTPGNEITFIQRICTKGGLAPATGADEAHLGQLDSIPYTASYLFYTKN